MAVLGKWSSLRGYVEREGSRRPRSGADDMGRSVHLQMRKCRVFTSDDERAACAMVIILVVILLVIGICIGRVIGHVELHWPVTFK